ncbi:MAG: 1-acyl-sn-glycerol-3-phosphate acyltransferase [Myxococcota bacterium]
MATAERLDPPPGAPRPTGRESRLQESLLTRWRRRAVTIPAIYLLWALATVLAPLLLVAALLLDGARRSRLVLTRAVMFFLVFLWFEAVALVATLLVWPLVVHPDTFRHLNARLQVWWNAGLFRAGCVIFGMRVVVEGRDVLQREGPLLVLVRHVSTVDAVIPVTLLSDVGRHLFRFVLKRELLTDPCLDVVGNRLPNCFVKRESDVRDDEVARVVGLLEGMGGEEALVIYPEGTRFSPSRRTRLLEKMPPGPPRELATTLQHTLPPLTRGTLALLGANRHADLVILGHTGLEGAAAFPDFIRGGLVGTTIHVWVRRIPRERIPADEAGQIALLSDEWRRMDGLIEAHRRAVM